jgi:hypothetical protein
MHNFIFRTQPSQFFQEYQIAKPTSHYSRCQKDTEQTLRVTPTTRPGDPTRPPAAAIITPTATGRTTTPMTMAAHTTTPAQVDKDQPPTPRHLPPEAEDRPKAPQDPSKNVP